MINWLPVDDPASPIIGYVLQMDDGRGGQFSTIFDGSYQPGVYSFLKSGLRTGLRYTFKVYAVNFNGLSLASPTSSFFVCTVPTGFAAPRVLDQTTSYINI